MAAAEKHSRKGRRKSHKNSFFCSFGGCFGISNKVSSDHGVGKSVKNVSGSSGRQEIAVRVNDQKSPKSSSSSEIVSSSKEIHVVEDEEKRSQTLAPSADELINNKAHDTTLEKSKTKDESSPMTSSIKRVDKQTSITQDTWTNPTKLSHSASLPLPREKKEKPVAAAGGRKDLRVAAGEFDPMVGAVIIMVTLVVMIIWGRVCAVLCTAAWFYFMPRFRANVEEFYATKLKNGENHIDFDSWEYKKKVVLQGLLDRNQHL